MTGHCLIFLGILLTVAMVSMPLTEAREDEKRYGPESAELLKKYGRSLQSTALAWFFG